MKESKPDHRFVAAVAMLGAAMAILCAAAQEHRSAGVLVALISRRSTVRDRGSNGDAASAGEKE